MTFVYGWFRPMHLPEYGNYDVIITDGTWLAAARHGTCYLQRRQNYFLLEEQHGLPTCHTMSFLAPVFVGCNTARVDGCSIHTTHEIVEYACQYDCLDFLVVGFLFCTKFQIR